MKILIFHLDFSICMQLEMEKVKTLLKIKLFFTRTKYLIFVSSRKGILQDIVKYTDFTTEKFLEIHMKVLKAVDSIKPIEEYKDFIGKHKYICNIIIISILKKYILTQILQIVMLM